MKRSFGFWLLPVAAVFLYAVGCGDRDNITTPKAKPVQAEAQAPQPSGDDDIDAVVATGADGSVQEAKKEYGIVLDYSPASIKKVDVILLKLHGQYVKDKNDQRWNIESLGWGAYVGEVIRRQYGGHWRKVDPSTGNPLPLVWRNGTSFPVTWCGGQIVEGGKDNVWTKYQLLTSPEYSKAYAAVKRT